MSPALGFVAGNLARGFTAHFFRPTRLREHLTRGLGHRHVDQHSFSFGPSPCSSASSARPGYYDLCCLLAPARHRRPFRHEARSPQVRPHSFTAQPPDLRRLSFDHKCFAATCPLALLGAALYPLLVHRLAASLHASSPHSVTLMQLRFASFVVIN
jgi:hypothetical protein